MLRKGDGLIRIVSPYFVVGIIVNTDGLVIEATGVVKYMRGWHEARVRDYCRFKGWEMQILDKEKILFTA